MSAPRWTYAAADVSARVETIRRGDRIYLSGGLGAAGRVVAELRHYPESRVGGHVVGESYVVVYFAGGRSGTTGDLIVNGMRPHAPGDRLRVRRCVRADAS